jgi:hypothetical protein
MDETKIASPMRERVRFNRGSIACGVILSNSAKKVDLMAQILRPLGFISS